MTSRWPGSRDAGGRGAAGCPVRLGGSLRPRATTRRANAKHRPLGHAAALVLKPPPRFLPLRTRRAPKPCWRRALRLE
eukprot:6592345-Alexandrium_andersonii.AAC.1